MKTTVTTRHFDLSDSLKERTEERLNRLSRFFDRIFDARVVVSLEKNRYNAEASVTLNGTPIASHTVADSDRAAVEQVLDKLETQIRRHKDRLTKNRRRQGGESEPGTGPASEYEGEREAETAEDREWDGLVNEEPVDFTETMPVPEAAAALKASGRESLGFTNTLDRRRMMVFKRRDGRVGVVDVHGD
jgi:putative sigma-54 modulation protein